MKKLKKFIDFQKKHRIVILTFIVASIIINTLYILNDVTPYGKKSLLCVDFFHQYGPMLGELFDRVKSFSGLIYSFNIGLGIPFFRNFLNYLSSPFNIIMYFFNKNHLVMSYSIIIGLKAVMSSVTMNYYLSKKFNTNNIAIIPLGLLYGFSAYFSAYYWNIMWLDGMVFVPLVTYGIEKIINENKWKLYTISLAIMLLANYFIGYMICIFSVVYFVLYLFYKVEFNTKKIKEFFSTIGNKIMTFAFASLLAGAIGAFLLLPMAKSMKSISATGGSFPTSQYYAFTVEDYLKYHFTGVETTTFSSDDINAPNISCGVLSVALLFIFIINPKIKLKTKICYSAMLGFFIFAFFNPIMDYILHAFHVPNDLPYRYSFLYSFVLTIIAAYSLINIKKIKFPFITIIYIILMIILSYMTQSSWVNLSNNMIYINMILLTLYYIFYSCDYYINGMHYLFYSAIIIVASIDAIVSINYNWDISQITANFYHDYNSIQEELDFINAQDDEKFYRIEKAQFLTLNDGAWYNYHGVNTFSSMAYENLAILQNHLGLPGNLINSYFYTQTTPVYDLLFDVKYILGKNNDLLRYHNIYEKDNITKFDYSNSIAFGVNNKVTYWDTSNRNPFIIQNDFVNKATGVTNVFESADLVNKEILTKQDNETIIKYNYKNTGDNMYFYSSNSTVNFVIIGNCLYYKDNSYGDYIDNNPYIDYYYTNDYSEEKIINISSAEKYVEIIVGYKNYYDDTINVYNINNDKFIDFYNKVSNSKMNITSFNDDNIKGNINLKEDMLIYTSIPYDEGWEVLVDGKPVETKSIGNALLAFNIKKGKHKINLKYNIPSFKIGTLITVIALVILIFGEKLVKKINELTQKKIKS